MPSQERNSGQFEYSELTKEERNCKARTRIVGMQVCWFIKKHLKSNSLAYV